MLDTWDWYTKLAEKSSFTKAAESLGMSQQTLSARLAALERELEAKLVVRGNPLQFTPAGMAFLVYARDQQQAQQDMLRQIGEVTGGGGGVLKVGIAHMRSRTLAPRVVKELSRVLPGVTLQLVEGTNRELTRMAERGEVDAVVARFSSSHPGVNVEPLYQEEVVLAVQRELLEATLGMPAERVLAKVAEEGLAVVGELPLVLGTVDDISGRIAYSELRNAGIRPRTIAVSENMATLLAMAAEGIGAVFAPNAALDATSGMTGTLVRIPLSAQATYTICVGLPMKAEHWSVLDTFTEVLKNAVK